MFCLGFDVHSLTVCVRVLALGYKQYEACEHDECAEEHPAKIPNPIGVEVGEHIQAIESSQPLYLPSFASVFGQSLERILVVCTI